MRERECSAARSSSPGAPSRNSYAVAKNLPSGQDKNHPLRSSRRSLSLSHSPLSVLLSHTRCLSQHSSSLSHTRSPSQSLTLSCSFSSLLSLALLLMFAFYSHLLGHVSLTLTRHVSRSFSLCLSSSFCLSFSLSLLPPLTHCLSFTVTELREVARVGGVGELVCQGCESMLKV